MALLADSFYCILSLCAILLPILWLASEFSRKIWLRLLLGIASMISALVLADNFGDMGGEFRANSYFAKANTRLIGATVSELEHDKSAAVLASLKQLQQHYQPNYENRSHFDELVEAAVKNMQSGPATAPH
jgi:hypothetical protein